MGSFVPDIRRWGKAPSSVLDCRVSRLHHLLKKECHMDHLEKAIEQIKKKFDETPEGTFLDPVYLTWAQAKAILERLES